MLKRFWRESKLGKWVRRLLRLSAALFFMLLILEVIYRNQWIDTYKSSLEALNDQATLEGKGRKILVLGDSFSASPEGWVKEFRMLKPGFHVINNAVSGTGIVQANIIAAKRLPQFKPDILLYQIYVGNDLADYRYPINWSSVSPFRNIYWWWAHRFRSIAYLNQATGQIQSGPSPTELEAIYSKPFSVEDYNSREKTLFRAEPAIIQNQIFLKDGREQDMEMYLRKLDDMLKRCEEYGTIVYLLVLPHYAQVHPAYKKQMESLGAEFGYAWHTRADYPFINKLAAHTLGRAHVLNPLPYLQSASKSGEPLYYNNDPHMTPAGQQLLGRWVVNAMAGTSVDF